MPVWLWADADETALDEEGARELLRRLTEANEEVKRRITAGRAAQEERAAARRVVGQQHRQRQLEARKLHQAGSPPSLTSASTCMLCRISRLADPCSHTRAHACAMETLECLLVYRVLHGWGHHSVYPWCAR